MVGRLAHHRLFFREFRRNFHTTGAILPSGPRLAAALSRHVGRGQAPKRILEVGPGTGAVTRSILRRLGAGDSLDLIEANAAFVAALCERFARDPAFRQAADRACVRHGRLEDIGNDASYDVIISGLPLNNFQPQEVEQILAAFDRLLAPQGTVSFFEYVAIRPAKALISRPDERRRLTGISRVLKSWFHEHRSGRELVLANVPPAWVHHARLANDPPPR